MNEPILYAGKPHLPPPTMQIRSRKETSTRDTVNARQFEKWQTDGPSLYNDRADLEGARVLLDMNPINTRTTTNSYRQSQPFVANGPQLGMNPYFDRYDPTFDPRNAIRELRSAVYEDKTGEKAVLESKKVLQREFANRWLPTGFTEIQQMDSLLSYEILRPKQDNIQVDYRSKKG